MKEKKTNSFCHTINVLVFFLCSFATYPSQDLPFHVTAKEEIDETMTEDQDTMIERVMKKISCEVIKKPASGQNRVELVKKILNVVIEHRASEGSIECKASMTLGRVLIRMIAAIASDVVMEEHHREIINYLGVKYRNLLCVCVFVSTEWTARRWNEQDRSNIQRTR